MTVIGKIRALSMRTEIHCRLDFYSAPHTRAEQLSIQLQRFNTVWKNISKQVPYYRERVEARHLPLQFHDWDEFCALMPISSRHDFQQNLDDRIDLRKKQDFIRDTGGSTFEPICLPAWNLEQASTRQDMWVGREWNGIRSQNKCFFLWGGRAFLDQGWRGQKILLKRAWKDRLLGYRRTYPFSLISDQDYLDALEKIVQFRPDYIMGHSSIVERFAFVNRACASELRLLHLKGVVLSAEMLNSPYSARVIEEVFGCPVIREYGAAEVDVMAYSTPQGYFSAFWNNHFLEILPSNDEKGGELLVTSLFPRCCPIIRYRIGDTIQLLDEDDGIEYGISRFKDIGGRVLDFLLMPDGQEVFAYIFPFVVRDDYELISRLQVVQSSQGYRMDVQSPVESLPEKVTDEMRRKLGKLHPDLSAIEIRVVKQLHQTERGKTPLIWREEIPSMNSAASSQIPVRDMGRSL